MFDKDMEVEEKRLALVDWLNSVVPHFYLSLKATDEELRASLVDGVVLCQILNKLKTGSVDEGADRLQSPECRTERIRRFLTAVAEMGLPTFEKFNLENGSMKPVLNCLSALKEQSMPHFVGAVSISSPDRRRGLSDSKFQRSMNSPLVSESPTTKIHGGHKFHEVFQLKPGLHVDLPATKISELMRSNSLDNAPTQSLLSVVNGILDESIERRNTEIPQRVACLLRKAVQEIERRISTQAEHLRTQSNLFKAREEKYQSRIRVLEALATGTSEESEIVMNQLQYIKEEKNKMVEKKQLEDGEVDKLKKENYQSNVEISSLKQELELAEKKHEVHFLEMETQAKLVKGGLEQRLKEQKKLLEDSKKKLKELELNADSKCQSWIQKEHKFESFIHVQYEALQELRHSSEAVRKDVLKTQKSYVEELNSLGKKLKGLVEAAQKYHTVLYENRKIYNELQDLKGNIRVYCRIRPFLPGENIKETVVENVGEDGEITISNPSRKDSQKSFRFNKVYDPTATQAKVFSDTQPLIRTVLDGYNVCIFAYGQTGSGKTYTMTGPEEATKDDWGVNYRALDDLFQISEDRRNYFKYEIGVQMIEIYNETIQDLLSSDGSRKKLGILAASQPSGLVVPDASMHPVGSTSDVIDLMTIGHQNRSVGSTAMNERSSRSHSVVTIYVQGTDLKTGASTRGTLHLVDLAGSERVDRSEATGDRLREAQHINKSLSALGDVIFALAQKSPHVPYRNSKLTQVLQSSLGGRAKTLMFVQVNPDMCSYSETFSTLKFAERVSGVELGTARSNKDGRDVKELMDQVASLKDMIARKDEEIERLQLLKDSKSPRPTVKRSLSSLRHGSSASPTSSIGGSPQRSPTIHSGKRSGIQKAASEQDNLSETDEGLRSSKSMSDLKHHNDSPRVKKLSGGELGSEEDDSEERLSEISDGDLYMENENDGVLGANIQTKSSKHADKLEENSEKTRTTRLSSPRSRVAGATTPSRLSQVKTNLRIATAFKKPASGTSSPVTPARRWT